MHFLLHQSSEIKSKIFRKKVSQKFIVEYLHSKSFRCKYVGMMKRYHPFLELYSIMKNCIWMLEKRISFGKKEKRKKNVKNTMNNR